MNALDNAGTHEFLTPREVARELRLSIQTARDLIRRHMVYVEVAAASRPHIRVERAAFDAYLRRVRKAGSDFAQPTKEEKRQAVRDRIAAKNT